MVDFLVLGLGQAFKYAEIFPLFVQKKVRFGTKVFGKGEHIWFRVDKAPGSSKKYIDERDGDIYTDVSGVCWFTSLDSGEKGTIELKERYEEGKYRYYDGTDVINIDSIYDVPVDYYGVMGVPVNFIDKLGDEFELVGAAGCGGRYNRFMPVVDGRCLYARILIQRKRGK